MKRKYVKQNARTVRMIRTLWATGRFTQTSLANLVDASQSNIHYIVNRITHG